MGVKASWLVSTGSFNRFDNLQICYASVECKRNERQLLL